METTIIVGAGNFLNLINYNLRCRGEDLGRRSQLNVRRATSRASRTDDQRQTEENSRIAMSELRSLVSDNVGDKLRMQRVRVHQTQQQQARHNENERIRRRSASVILERAAFHYDPAIDYCADKTVTIAEMKTLCKYCKALKYTGKSTGLCCAEGKVKLPQLVPPPDPLRSLVSGIGNDSKHFLTNIQKYNNCVQMPSFGATHIIQANFMPTFKNQGQFYHLLGTLLPLPDADHQFLQIYFMGNSDAEINIRCAHKPTVKRTIVQQLQIFLHQNNNLVNMIKIALDRMPSDSHNTGRLAVKRLMNNVIETTIIKGKYKGEDVLIPRIPMIPTDTPFDFKRLQFPVRLDFAMTINKSEGQSLEVCGINLEFPYFAHGQLDVSCSGVGKPSSLFIYAPQNKTKNIVYEKAFN
ncbi:uncharacterized protein LOC116655397 [Drosophila ananassae]|uniref:uncharacterized protein LOC116655397 n=1 Tax=Drosophila ananassae TaxID=7217 RepID=UPI001CFFE137|nr:uncharacterized protein LOC116655397 [Drosophila ananassae]